MPLNSAPSTVLEPSASLGMVMIISGSESESRLAITGPGSLMCGEFVSPSRLFRGNPSSQLDPPVSESIFHTHISPLLASMVVSRTNPVVSSICAKDGSEGWLPLSRFTCQITLGVPLVCRGRARTTGSSETSSIAAMTSSASPFRSISASSGWVVGLCPPRMLLLYGPSSLLIIRDSSVQVHNFSSEWPFWAQPVTEHDNLGDHASTCIVPAAS